MNVRKPIDTFEFTDLAWWPAPFRLSLTNYLSWMNEKFGVSRFVADKMHDLLIRTNAHTVVDLCSGSGGPWKSILKTMHEERKLEQLRVVCTDKFPSVSSSYVMGPFRQDFETQSVDAAEAIEQFDGPFTIMNGFHHLDRAAIDELISTAGKKRVALAIFEGTNPSLLDSLISPLAALLFLQYSLLHIKRISTVQLLCTFVIPVIPLFIAWDVFASNLRSYRSGDMKALLLQSYNEAEITSGTDKVGPIRVTWAIAQPRKE